MNKVKIIEDINRSLMILNRRKRIIETIPIGVYLLLTGKEWQRETSMEEKYQAFVKLISYNRSSARFRVLATNAHRFRGDPSAIYYDSILEWRPLKIEDLPMGMSWKKFPLYEKMLQDGKLTQSDKIDFVPLKDLKFTKTSNGIWNDVSYAVPCRVCGQAVRIWFPHTHRCHKCGYTFRTKENLKRVIMDMNGEVNEKL